MTDETDISTNVVHFDFRGPLDHEILRELFAEFVERLQAHDFDEREIEDALFTVLMAFLKHRAGESDVLPQPEKPTWTLYRESIKRLSGYLVERYDAPIEGKDIKLPYLG